VLAADVRNVTLGADEKLIASARPIAQARQSTLDQLFRDWLSELVRGPAPGHRYDQLMEQWEQVESGRAFTRDELHER